MLTGSDPAVRRPEIDCRRVSGQWPLRLPSSSR